MIKINNKIKLKRISVELEVEHRRFNRNQLSKYRKYLKKKFPDIRISYDYSLYNGGIELSGPLFPLSNWKSIFRELHSKKFIVNTRTGFHMHFDITNIIKNIENLKDMIKGILNVQLHRPNYFNKHISAFHQVFPIMLLKSLLNSNTIKELVSKYLYELRGGSTSKNLNKALEKKYSEHDYWIDLTPIMRYLIDYKHPIGKYKRVVGSIEIRGKATNSTFKDIVVSYDQFIQNVYELTDLLKKVLSNV